MFQAEWNEANLHWQQWQREGVSRTGTLNTNFNFFFTSTQPKVGSEGQKYFWTGGNVRGRSINWPSGRRYNNVNWSNTGGWGSNLWSNLCREKMPGGFIIGRLHRPVFIFCFWCCVPAKEGYLLLSTNQTWQPGPSTITIKESLILFNENCI